LLFGGQEKKTLVAREGLTSVSPSIPNMQIFNIGEFSFAHVEMAYSKNTQMRE